jgi:hypothetical protein
MKRKSLVVCTAALAMIAGGLLGSQGKLEAAAKQTLTAKQVKQAPSGLDDPAWNAVKAIEVPFVGKEKFAGKQAAVATKAVYSGDRIYFLFNWKDPTLSVTKGAWQYDGDKWMHLKGDEDRITLLFEINRISNFATKGCAILCHVAPGAASAKGGKFGTASAAEKGDLWHWKAARSDPAGVAEDTYVTVIGDKEGGRKGDAGPGGDMKNETDDKAKPKSMLAPGKQLGKNNILLAEDAVEIKDYAAFKAGDGITYRMPIKHEGSRGDIGAVSRYADGAWTVMLSRKLDTAHDDDVAFNTRKNYNFAMALFDDSSDENSYDSEVIGLEFGQ